MGRAVESEAIARGHEIVACIDKENLDQVAQLQPDQVDCVIEFSHPEAAIPNFSALLKQNVAVVTGTTGWYDRMEEMQHLVEHNDQSFLWTSNFSIGVNILFELNKKMAEIMNRYPDYDVYVEESHHRMKKDAPSGTGISLADQILDGLGRKTSWITDEIQHRAPNPHELTIASSRAGGIIGKHTVTYTSEIDEISLTHNAYNRRGFALGAVVAAEWLVGKKGFFHFSDVLKG
ncbi:UNVERIFIED_CONTAM: hypothetical protein GTU68_026482 [Idotea baltica]|nr:hypothetical protein [Idotea baltica]